MSKFLNNINLEAANDIQFKTTAGANAGKIEQDGNNLVLSNAVGDVLLGDGSSDVYIGDGTNNVDILFEQSGSIKGDGSAVTLTIGGANTTLNLENPNINGALSIGSTSIDNKLTFTSSSGYILFDYEPTTAGGEYTSEVPLLKVDRSGSELTVLSRLSNNGAIALGNDDAVAIVAGDTKSVIKDNWNYAAEIVILASEGGFYAYGFPSNNTAWSNRNEFRFRSDSGTASDNGLYIGEGGSTQFIDVNRNLKNIGTIGAGAITSSGSVTATEFRPTNIVTNKVVKFNGTQLDDANITDTGSLITLGSNTVVSGELEATSLDINGNADIAGELQVTTNGTATLILRGDNNNSGDTGQLDSAIKMLHDDGTHGILMETKNFAGKQSFEIKSLSAGTESSRFLIHQDNYITTSGAVTAGGSVTATSFIKSGGTSSQFLKANGNVDGNTYATESYVSTQISNLVDSSPAALNTLNELAAALGDDASFSTTMSTSLGNRLRVDTASQGLNSTQKSNGRTNLGLGTAATSASTAFATAAQGTSAETAFGWGNHASAGYAPLASPALTGNPTAPTQSSSESSTKIATTAYVKSQGYITSADGGNATQLDGIDSSSFLRSDTADTATGNLNFNGTQSWRETTRWQVNTTDDANQRADARNDDTDKARLHWYGQTDGGTNTNFRHAWYDGSNYVNVDVTSPKTVTFDGVISATGGNSTNWNTAYGWGDHASAGYAPLASPALTGSPTAPTPSLSDNNTNIATTEYVKSQSYLTSYTETDTLATVTARGATTTTALTINRASGTMINTGAQSDAFGYNASYGHYIRGNNSTYIYGNGTLYTGGAYRTLFHDTYHPNADTLTTARTISLAGDVTGSVSFNGSSNVSITTVVGNDSHTHDGRYYTETESANHFKTLVVQGNFMNTYSWSGDTVGSANSGWSALGSAAPFSGTDSYGQNGTDAENSRAIATLPNGAKGVVWRTPSNDSSSNDDGGWNCNINGVDSSKSYRSVIYFRKTDDSNNGQFYHGCHGSHTLNIDGSANTNPYFASLSISNFVQDRWYVSIGYIQPYQSSGAVTSGQSGVYDCTTGKLVSGGQDFMMKSGSTTQNHRTYLYYSTDTNTSVEFYAPRFEELNGNEPSKQELVNKGLDGLDAMSFHSKYDPEALTQLTESSDANDDKFLLWDESASVWKYMRLDDLQDSIDNNTTYVAGNGISLSSTTFSVSAGGGLTQTSTGLSHTDTSTQGSVNNSSGTVIQDITLDTYGHITAIGSANLDGRYYTETETNGFLNLKADLASPALTGNPTAPTQAANNNSTRIATTAYVQTEIADLIGAAPAALDTLSELADAINDDSAFSSTVTTALGNRLRVDTASQGLNSTQKSNARTNLGLGSAATSNTSAFLGATAKAADSELLDGEEGSHYLDYNNFTNTPVDQDTTYSAGTGISLSGTTFSLTDTASKLSLSGGTLTGTLNSRDIKLGSGYHLMRSNHHSGHLEGSYNNVGDNGTKSNPIYTIGSSYNPTDAALSNMYGIGYTHGNNASFISMTGASGWGMYVAADGDARVFLSGANGTISSTGQHYVGSSVVWNAGNDGTGSGLDADLLDGMQSHTGRNNEANKVVRTDGNGYIQAGWINTTSGNNGTTAISRIYASQDGYIRYYTPANFGAQIGSHISYNDLTNKPTIPSAYSLPLSSSSTRGGVKIGFSESGKNYPVELDSSEKMFVNVPWTDNNTTYSVGDGGLTQKNFTSTLKTKLDGIATSANNYSLPEATATARGGIELFSNTDQSVAANSVSSTASRTYGIQLNSAGQAVVNVPWVDTNTNTTYSVGDGGLTQKNFTSTLKTKLDGIATSANNYSLPAGSSSTRGGFKIGYTESGKYYPVEVDSSEKMFVNVPWVDTNTDTNTTYSAGRGLDLSGTQFQLETDLRDSISYIGYDSNDYIQWSNNSYVRAVVSGTERFRVNTSGIDVNGTATASGFQTDTSSSNYNLISRNGTSFTLYVQAAQSNSTQPIASFRYGSATANGGTETFRIRKDNVNVFGANFTVGGSITGNSKNFSIPHPTKEGKRLVHSCLEGPEIGVYFRGRSQSSTIEMPDYWAGLVHLDSMTVELTAIGPNQDLYVASIADDGDVTVASNTDTALNYFYVVYGERKDLERLEVEIDDTVEVEESLDNFEESEEI
jgi:hypothetical protein